MQHVFASALVLTAILASTPAGAQNKAAAISNAMQGSPRFNHGEGKRS